ncbi:YbaB/EbfC family nucleoid-associated protein [Patescibacteria group bacterium]|nr:YbaB/EbfC family nucleoid-associated protein [Patescibacteria group bacterium]
MFDKAKEMYQLQKKAKEIQKQLKNTEVEAQSSNGQVIVVFTADQKMKSISINEEMLKSEKKRDLEEIIMKVISEALSRSQAVAAEKTKGLMGEMGLNIPGM